MFLFTPESEFDLTVPGVVRKGYGVASGLGDSSVYPEGTLLMQMPLFHERGVDLSEFFLGTLNVDISPCSFAWINPDITLRQLAWTDRIPAEDFSFTACLLQVHGASVHALVYYPHPETKVEHFQHDSVMEILAPFVNEMAEGVLVTLGFRSRQVRIEPGAG